jgi:nitrate/nitrite transporter NarK
VIGDSAQFSAIVTEVGDPSLVGTALALQLGIGFALTVVAIWIMPAFADWIGGWQWAFVILAPGPVIGVGDAFATPNARGDQDRSRSPIEKFRNCPGLSAGIKPPVGRRSSGGAEWSVS